MAATGHIASLFTLDGDLAPEYLVLTGLLMVLPPVVLVTLKVKKSRRTEAAHRASRAARGRQGTRAAASKIGLLQRAKTAVVQSESAAPATTAMDDASSDTSKSDNEREPTPVEYFEKNLSPRRLSPMPERERVQPRPPELAMEVWSMEPGVVEHF